MAPSILLLAEAEFNFVIGGEHVVESFFSDFSETDLNHDTDVSGLSEDTPVMIWWVREA